MSAKTVAWRCFHCDEVFTDHATAALHFGNSEHHHPACQIDIAEYRRMEETHRRHCEEDTDLHREIHAAHSAGNERARRAEEQGYARGLSDFQAEHTRAEQLAEENDEANSKLASIADTTAEAIRNTCSMPHPQIALDTDLRPHIWSLSFEANRRQVRAERAEAALRDAAYALFQIKRMVPEAVREFASNAHVKACTVLDNGAIVEGEKHGT